LQHQIQIYYLNSSPDQKMAEKGDTKFQYYFNIY